MQVDAMLDADPAKALESAAAFEDEGFAGVWCGETAHDPFVTLTAAALGTKRVRLGSGVAIAFARSPMTLAMLGNDLQTVSRGRFVLGLGTQVRPHIERRYGMTWSRPAARMHELVLAIRHIWACWRDGTRLDFTGEFFTHTLMTPVFDPGPNRFGTPDIMVAAVGKLMTGIAGECADGVLLHSFVTERFLREVAMPAFQAGIERSGRQRRDLCVSYPVFVATGSTQPQLESAIDAVRQQIAFYGSTPSYRDVLTLHGWDDVHKELHELSRDGKWSLMKSLIDDAILEAFAVVGDGPAVARAILKRYGDLVDRVTLYTPYAVETRVLGEIASVLGQAPIAKV
jgi:probable F420-dependent oxidoreductase